jgi:hypothetical protein
VLTWSEAKRRIVKRVPPGSLTQLCADCQWLELGLCETALRALHADTKPDNGTPDSVSVQKE